MSSSALVGVLSVALLGAACSLPDGREPSSADAQASPLRRASLAGFNVVLVVVDTLRADHLGYHGYRRATSPHIDRFAAEGVTFLEARSPLSFTRESVAALFTGEHSSCTGAAGWSASPPAAMTTLAERLLEAGYVTGFLSNSPVIDLPGLTQGFEEIEHLGEESTTSGLAVPLTERAGLFLERHKDERFFLYVHYLDPHGLTDLPRG